MIFGTFILKNKALLCIKLISELKKKTMRVEQLYTNCLAEAAYYIESNGEAAIIDPLRESTPYIDLAKKSGAKIKYIFETHFHADFVSGHIDLARKTGADIVFGPTAKADFEIIEATDHQVFKVGNVTITVLHTPGHTMESMTLLLKDESGKDHAIFSGDTLFLGDVGRPDLAVKSDLTQTDLATHLFHSLRDKIMPLADEVIVYPGHGAGSACGKNLSSETVDTLGNQKKTNYALRADMTVDEFVKEVTTGLKTPPQYFPNNVKLNKTGYESVDVVLERGTLPLSASDVQAYIDSKDVLILDTRSTEDYSQAHIPNSWFIGLNGSFAPWVGALIKDINQKIVIIADLGKEKEVAIRLSRVGYDNTIGFLDGGIDTWIKADYKTESIQNTNAQSLVSKMDTISVLDVRKDTEYYSQHVKSNDIINLPLDNLQDTLDKIDPNKTYYTHCLGGYRSLIAISILKSKGFHNFINIEGGIRTLEEENIPMTDYVCPSTMME
mgnify:CR=1 FL=1